MRFSRKLKRKRWISRSSKRKYSETWNWSRKSFQIYIRWHSKPFRKQFNRHL